MAHVASGRWSGRSSRSSRAARSPGSPTASSSSGSSTGRDAAGEAAFAALVARHGPMVLDVCRQLLGDRHHAEDAFQAVFLVLARKARSIRDPDLLGNWLYGVALRTARKARVRLARRRQNEEGDADEAGPGSARVDRRPPADQPAWTASRPRPCTTRSTGCRSPSACRWCSATSRASPLDEAARRLRCPGRHGPQPTGPGAGQAPPRPHPPRRRLARRRTGRGPRRPARLGVRLIPPVRHHDPGRDPTSRPDRPPRPLGGGPCPGGAPRPCCSTS